MAKIRSALPYIFLFFLTAVVLDLGNPLFDKPARDGGFFLYAGSQIVDGKIPYVDFWDSKGPAIFFINALGSVSYTHLDVYKRQMMIIKGDTLAN